MRSLGKRARWDQPGRTLFLLSVSLLICCSTLEARGTSWATPPAISSNVLIYQGKVLFVQGTGGLTVLDLDTGKVLLRKMLDDDYGYVGELLSCPAGVILYSHRQATAVDASTLEPLWTIEECNHPLVVDSNILCHDGYHAVRCHDSKTGKERWSKELRGGWDLALSKDVAAVATVPYYDGRPTVWAIAADTGEQLFETEAPEGKQWCNVYCDNEYVYALTTPLESPDFSKKPDGVVKYDFNGNELDHIDFSSPKLTQLHKTYDYPFMLDGRVFPNQENIRVPFAHELESDSVRKILENYDDQTLPSGLLRVFEQKDSSGKQGQLIQFLSPENRWTAHVSYFRPNEWFSSMQEVDGKIVVASSGGQVECLDSQTGKPNWLYVFPSFRRILHASDSYIGTYWTSRETTRASIFRKGLRSYREKVGCVLLPSDFSSTEVTWNKTAKESLYQAPIIMDPVPELRFKNLPRRVLRSRIVAGASVIGLAAILAWYWRRLGSLPPLNEDSRQLHKNKHLLFFAACFGVIAIAATCITFYGRVSFTCTAICWAVAIIGLLLTQKAMTTLLGDKAGVWPYILGALWGGVLALFIVSNTYP